MLLLRSGRATPTAPPGAHRWEESMLERRQQRVAAFVLWGMTSLTAVGCGDSKKQETATDVTEANPSATAAEALSEATMPATVLEPVLYTEAEKAYNESRFEEAVGLFKRYTAGKPENPWGYYMLGLSAWKNRDLDDAETGFLRAIEMDSSHVKSRINLARVYLDKEEPGKAVAQVELAMKLDSTSAEGFRLLGRVRDELGLYPEAELAYRQALTIDGADAWAMNNLGLNFIKQGKLERSIGVLARVTQLKPDSPRFHNNLGMALELNGYFSAAAAAYQAAVAIDGSYGKAIDNLARVSELKDKEGMPELDLVKLADGFTAEIEASKIVPQP